MSKVNGVVLNSVNNYRNNLDFQLSNLLQWVYNMNYHNLFISENYKLYSLISENIRMDIAYLSMLNPDYDVFGFPGMNRNIRNSIEAFYDLYNLTHINNYLSAMKYASKKAVTEKEDYENVDKIAADFGIEKVEGKNGKKHYEFNIKIKADIAKEQGLPEELYNSLKSYCIDANSYVNPDIFNDPILINDKSDVLKKLINADCLLLAHAYGFLIVYINKTFNYICNFDPYMELNNIKLALAQQGSYIWP